MDLADLEGEAQRLYDLADADSSAPPGSAVLAERLLGRGAVRKDARPLVGNASLVRVRDAWRVFVRPKLRPHVEELAILHELAEWALRGRVHEHIEGLADQLSYRLRMPGRAFRRWAAEVGPQNLEAVAEPFLASQSAVALRWGEVTGQPVALMAA